MTKFSHIDLRFIFLAAMLVFLPSLEALKNIFAFLFVLSWILFAYKSNQWGGKWRAIDLIFLLWLVVAIVVSLNAVFNHQLSGSGFRDPLRFVLIGWVISRISFTRNQLTLLCIISIIGTILAIIYGYYIGGGNLKELYSVGHINHSAIFLLITYTISLSILMFDFKNLDRYQKTFLFFTTIILFWTTIDTGSRAAFGILILITLFNFIYLSISVKKLSIVIGLFLILSLIFFSLLKNPPTALNRLIFIPLATDTQKHIFYDVDRKRVNNYSYYIFKSYPILGVGFKNYNQINFEDIRDHIVADKGIYDPDLYHFSAHAHNLYFNYLTSGGLLIFSILVWFWLCIFWVILRLIKVEKSWLIICSMGVMIINLAIGLVNTTLHHEHAILSMLILGSLIARYRVIAENNSVNS